MSHSKRTGLILQFTVLLCCLWLISSSISINESHGCRDRQCCNTFFSELFSLPFFFFPFLFSIIASLNDVNSYSYMHNINSYLLLNTTYDHIYCEQDIFSYLFIYLPTNTNESQCFIIFIGLLCHTKNC